MKKTDSSLSSSTNSKLHISQSKNKYVQNIFNEIYDDEFISYINELSLSIKSFYKCVNPNLSTISNLLNSSELIELLSKLNNKTSKSHSSLRQSFHDIENSFSKFYQNAKIIFKQMKVYRNERIENIINNYQKSESPKKKEIEDYQNNNGVTNSIHNDGINVNKTNFSMVINKENNLNKNFKIKLDKLKNENINLKKKVELLEKKGKTLSPNKIPKPTKNENYHSQNNNQRRINTSVNDDERNNSNSSFSQSLSFYDEKLKIFQKENEKYKKHLHKLSYEINRFLINFKQIKNLEIPEGLKTSLEKGKITLNQLTSNFLKKNNDFSINHNNSSYNDDELKNYKETVIKLKLEKEKIKNDNIELRKEIDILKNSTSNNKLNSNSSSKSINSNHIRKDSVNSNNNSISNNSNNNNISILKNQNDELKKKNDELSLKLSKKDTLIQKNSVEFNNKFNQLNEKINHLKSKNHDLKNELRKSQNFNNNNLNDNNKQIDKTDNEIINLNKKNIELTNKLKEANEIVNKYENTIKELKANEKSIKNKLEDEIKDIKNNNEKHIKEIEKLQKENNSLKQEKIIENNLENENESLKKEIVEIEKRIIKWYFRTKK